MPADQSPLLSPFDRLPASMQGERDALRLEALNLIRTRVKPAEAKVADFFQNEYLPKSRDSLGASELPNGRAYYANRVRRETTTSIAKQDFRTARSDLDVVNRLLAPQANERFDLANLYVEAASPLQALAEFDDWIKFHPEDQKIGLALSGRCFSRAIVGADLPKAAVDCDRGLKEKRGEIFSLSGRGYIRLRQGNLAGAIADFTTALDAEKQDGWAFWGRGLAEARQGQSAQAKLDFAAARKASPDLENVVQKLGLGVP